MFLAYVPLSGPVCSSTMARSVGRGVAAIVIRLFMQPNAVPQRMPPASRGAAVAFALLCCAYVSTYMAGTWWLLGTGVLHGEGQPLAGPRVLNELIADDIRCAMVCAWPPIPTAAGAILSLGPCHARIHCRSGRYNGQIKKCFTAAGGRTALRQACARFSLPPPRAGLTFSTPTLTMAMQMTA